MRIDEPPKTTLERIPGISRNVHFCRSKNDLFGCPTSIAGLTALTSIRRFDRGLFRPAVAEAGKQRVTNSRPVLYGKDLDNSDLGVIPHNNGNATIEAILMTNIAVG